MVALGVRLCEENPSVAMEYFLSPWHPSLGTRPAFADEETRLQKYGLALEQDGDDAVRRGRWKYLSFLELPLVVDAGHEELDPFCSYAELQLRLPVATALNFSHVFCSFYRSAWHLVPFLVLLHVVVPRCAAALW